MNLAGWTLTAAHAISDDGNTIADQGIDVFGDGEAFVAYIGPDRIDNCLNDPNKTEPGVCGCGIADRDSDRDRTLDCMDANDDGDGLPDGEEQGSDRNKPIYDGNGDGIADYLQGNVASLL